MNFGKYLKANAIWITHKNHFDNLLIMPTTEAQLFEQMEKLRYHPYTQRKGIFLLDVEFCLNEIALRSATTVEQKMVLQLFDKYWQKFVRLKNTLANNNLLLPADKITRVEKVAQLICQCTQFCVSASKLEQILQKSQKILALTERETDYLSTVVDLYKIKYYVAVTKSVFKKQSLGITALAKMQTDTQICSYKYNKLYFNGTFSDKECIALCDCMGQSAMCYKGNNVDFYAKTSLYKNNRNVFDTFTNSHFDCQFANFFSNTKQVAIYNKYFLHNGMEVCKYDITNNGKNAGNFLFEVVAKGKIQECFCTSNCLCIATSKHYVAIALVVDGQILPCQIYQNSLQYKIKLQSNEVAHFDLVTIYAEGMEQLSNKIASLQIFGATYCPHIVKGEQKVNYGQDLHLSVCSNAQHTPPNFPAKKLNFTCRLGDDNVATFVDNDGNNATLLGGFVFGVGGEKIYGIKNGFFQLLNHGKFTLTDTLTFSENRCIITHDKNKIISVFHKTPQKTLFYFPFERQSKVKLENNVFCIDDGKRQYKIAFEGKLQTFTTDQMECNPDRLRYKLSNEKNCGNCLAFCLDTSSAVKITISPATILPKSTPLVAESLVSTYLNYVNDKEVFCLANNLTKPTALTLAGICYTNPDFVKNYLEKLWEGTQDISFYDASGNMRKSKDTLLFDLACIYYSQLTCDGVFPTKEMKKEIICHLLNDKFDRLQLPIQALALKKLSQLNWGDKVRCLVEYTSLKKAICNDTQLYPYAQAIGAVELVNPSKDRLKDLCNKHGIPKNWYYVSQLENIYGLKLNSHSLRITPTVSSENALEQFALNFAGKRIQTTFSKGTVQSMILNGATCYQPFDPYSLKLTENTLVVRY